MKKLRVLNSPSELFHIRKNDQIIFAIKVELEEELNRDKLREAVDESFQQIPAFKVKTKVGISAHFIKNEKRIPIFIEEFNIPKPFNYAENNDYLFRIVTQEYSIMFLFSHSLTDGTGVMAYVKCCMALYTDSEYSVPSHDKQMENGFDKFSTVRPSSLNQGKKVINRHVFSGIQQKSNIYSYTLNIQKMLIRAKQLNCSLTVFIAAALVTSMYRTHKVYDDLWLAIPIDYRRRFPSESLYNFSGSIDVPVTNNASLTDFSHSIEQITNHFNKRFDENSIKESLIFSNTLRRFPINIVPIIIKRWYLTKNTGKKIHSINLSNLGPIVPDKIKGIKNIKFLLPAVDNDPISAAVLTYGDLVNINITSVLVNDDFFKSFEMLVNGTYL